MTTSHIEARFIEPIQCLAVKQLPQGEDWEYELKLDGYHQWQLGSPETGSQPVFRKPLRVDLRK